MRSPQERAVSELMPEVPVLSPFRVHGGDQIGASDRHEQQQVRGARIVPTGKKAVDYVTRPIRVS